MRQAHVTCASLRLGEVRAAGVRRLTIDNAERIVAEFLDVPHAVLFASSRGAIGAALRAVGPALSVVVPAYTCAAVANAAVSAKLAIAWADVDGRGVPRFATYHPSSILIAQDTYGFDSLAPDGARIVRDASHRPDFVCRSTSSIAVTSFEPSKWLSGAGGGLAVTADDELAKSLHRLRDDHTTGESSARQLAFTVAHLISGRLLYRGARLRGRVAGRVGRLIDSDKTAGQSARELRGAGIEPRLLGRPTRFAASLMVSQLQRITDIGRHRSELTALYDERFGIRREPHPLIRYPLAVGDRPTALTHFHESGWDLGRPWFSTPLHPTAPTAFGLDDVPPTARRLAGTVVNLPTHPLVSPADATALADLAAEVGAKPLVEDEEA